MTTILTSLLVGAHFRPPAKQVIACLPSGAPLALQPEPENPYDEHALRVLVWPREVPPAVRPELESCLEGTGTSLQELLDTEEPLFIGYVAASGGKPLVKAGLTTGNQEFGAALAADPSAQATLAFGPDGSPRVQLSSEAV